MKNIFFGLALLCLPLFLNAQSKSIENFYNRYKGMDEVLAINISGALINFVFANSDEGDEEAASKITNIRVLLVEKGSVVKNRDYNSLLKSIKKDNFEELMRIKDGGDAVNFHLREKGNRITDVLVTIHGEDNFLMLNLEGSFDYEDLNELDLNLEGGEHLKKIPKKKKKMDRA